MAVHRWIDRPFRRVRTEPSRLPLVGLVGVLALATHVTPVLARSPQGRTPAAPAGTLPTAVGGTWAGTVALDSASLAAGVPIRLSIARDGTVTGVVGDATLSDARLVRSRSLFRRVLGLGAPWMLEARLIGPLDARAGLRRERARMPLELVDGNLVGDFNATGGGTVLSVQARLSRS